MPERSPRETRQEWQARRDAERLEAARHRLAWVEAHCTEEEQRAVERKVSDRFDKEWEQYCSQYPERVIQP